MRAVSSYLPASTPISPMPVSSSLLLSLHSLSSVLLFCRTSLHTHGSLLVRSMAVQTLGINPSSASSVSTSLPFDSMGIGKYSTDEDELAEEMVGKAKENLETVLGLLKESEEYELEKGNYLVAQQLKNHAVLLQEKLGEAIQKIRLKKQRKEKERLRIVQESLLANKSEEFESAAKQALLKFPPKIQQLKQLQNVEVETLEKKLLAEAPIFRISKAAVDVRFFNNNCFK